MKLRWEYPLPRSEHPRDYEYEGSILDLRTGEELDRLQLGTEIVGDIATDGERVYTVAWPEEESPVRLVCIDLGTVG